MRTAIVTLGLAMLVGDGGAWADDQGEKKPTAGTMERTQAGFNAELAKHLGAVDVYIESAVVNVKLLSAMADLPSGKMDRQIISEVNKNIDQAIERAQTHLQHVRQVGGMAAMDSSMGAEKQPVAGGISESRIDEIEHHLKAAKQASRKLRDVKQATELSRWLDGITSGLMNADEAIDEVARMAHVTPIKDVNLRMPVKGTEEMKKEDTEKKQGY